MKTSIPPLFSPFIFLIFLTLSCGSQQSNHPINEEEGAAGAAEANLEETAAEGDQEETEIFNPEKGVGTSGDTGDSDTESAGDTGGETFIAGHGSYSEEYVSDWSQLANGKELAQKDLPAVTFIPVTYEESGSRYKYDGSENHPYINPDAKSVTIKDLYLEVSWNATSAQKYVTDVIYIKGAEEVLLENVYIRQMDSTSLGYDTVHIEGCGTATIRNSYFAGSAKSYHVRIEGCENVLVEYTEFSGSDYTPDDGVDNYIGAGGLMVDNGQKGDTPERELGWLVVQNNYFHDYNSSSGTGNQDFLGIASPSDGTAFNNYFSNMKSTGSIDACADIGHRRGDDPNYQNKLFRVERNFFDDCTIVKTPGDDTDKNVLFWVNNLYINVGVDDYHEGYRIFRLHETFVYDDAVDPIKGLYYKMSGTPSGKTWLGNNFIHASDKLLKAVYYQSGSAQSDNYQKMLISDYQTFVADNSPALLSGSKLPATGAIKTFSDWQDTNHDVNSSYQTSGSCFYNASSGDYRLTSTCPAVGSACTTCGASYLSEGDFLLDHPGMRITQDFLGNPRTTSASNGAFEPVEE